MRHIKLDARLRRQAVEKGIHVSLIEWRLEYEIGIRDVDQEHRMLIDLINTSFDELERGAGVEAAEALLGEIDARMTAHFALEEKAMREMEYGELGVHKADHERLLDEIRDLMDEVDERQGVDANVLGQRLDNWFSEHFRTRDATLHHFLRRRDG